MDKVKARKIVDEYAKDLDNAKTEKQILDAIDSFRIKSWLFVFGEKTH